MSQSCWHKINHHTLCACDAEALLRRSTEWNMAQFMTFLLWNPVFSTLQWIMRGTNIYGRGQASETMTKFPYRAYIPIYMSWESLHENAGTTVNTTWQPTAWRSHHHSHGWFPPGKHSPLKTQFSSSGSGICPPVPLRGLSNLIPVSPQKPQWTRPRDHLCLSLGFTKTWRPVEGKQLTHDHSEN